MDRVSIGGLSINLSADILVDCQPIYRPLCQPILGQQSVNSRLICWRHKIPTAFRLKTLSDTLPTDCRHITDTCLKSRSMHQSRGGLELTDCQSRQSASGIRDSDCWLIHHRYLTHDSRSRVHWYTGDKLLMLSQPIVGRFFGQYLTEGKTSFSQSVFSLSGGNW